MTVDTRSTIIDIGYARATHIRSMSTDACLRICTPLNFRGLHARALCKAENKIDQIPPGPIPPPLPAAHYRQAFYHDIVENTYTRWS